MNKIHQLFIQLALLSILFTAAASQAASRPQVSLKTDLGEIIIELYPDKAPITVANFLQYVDDKFYNGLIFHRVVPNFMVQTGSVNYDFIRRTTRGNIDNESGNGLKNTCGTLAMARLTDADSASSQFFINLKHNRHLDADDGNDGYTVFAKVIKGIRIAEAIANETRGQYRPPYHNAPNVPVRILKAQRSRGHKIHKTHCKKK